MNRSTLTEIVPKWGELANNTNAASVRSTDSSARVFSPAAHLKSAFMCHRERSATIF